MDKTKNLDELDYCVFCPVCGRQLFCGKKFNIKISCPKCGIRVGCNLISERYVIALDLALNQKDCDI